MGLLLGLGILDYALNLTQCLFNDMYNCDGPVKKPELRPVLFEGLQYSSVKLAVLNMHSNEADVIPRTYLKPKPIPKSNTNLKK